MKIKKILMILGILAVMILVGCARTQTQNEPGAVETRSTGNAVADTGAKIGLAKGNLAPDFELETVDGKKVSLDDFKEDGKPVLVYFFATWCPHCRNDFTVLNEVYKEGYEDIPIVASSLDLSENSKLISNYIKKYPNLDGVLFGPGKQNVLRDYNVRYTTTKYAIGRDGTVLYAGSGELRDNQWRVLLDLLKRS